ncbi:MAG: radical SAM protein [Candidatus Fermentibacteria bacterium]
MLQRSTMYRFPWTQVDTPGTWIEVTDSCDLSCPGCFRHQLEGHRPLEVIKEEILLCQELTNCERVAIAGGEPLIYPDLTEVVAFIAEQGMKPVLMTNGESLTPEYARDLKKAGLVQFYFHVDSGQQRPGWEDADEKKMNELRDYYADMVANIGDVTCGYNITISRDNLSSVPDIIRWSISRIDSVQSVSLIAIRGLPVSEGKEYRVGDEKIDLSRIRYPVDSAGDMDITSDEMYELISRTNPALIPCAYLNGTTDPSTNKFLVIAPIGCRDELYGVCGARTIELSQVFNHFFRGRYTSLVRAPRPSISIFLASIPDGEVRKAFASYLKALIRNPSKLFARVSLQCINLVQPTELIDNEKNFCDGCINLIPWKGKMVHSCALDEYRIFGGPLIPL